MTDPADSDRGRGAPPGAPRWAKVAAGIATVVALLIIGVLLLGGGGHGPAQHSSSGVPGGTPSDPALGPAGTGGSTPGRLR